jgi:BirA family biotin operon repressor/biotin-[acetyl-CoA-carboxylase] ligase
MRDDIRVSAVTWDGDTAHGLAARCAVPHVELLAETESTQDVAHVLAENGAPAGTLVLADSQRAGRGRLGRSWSSQPGRGVWCTLIERPLDTKALEVLSIRAGLLVAEALDDLAGARVGLKWPNDLVVPRAVIPRSAATSGYRRQRVLQLGKLGGILTEAHWSGASLAWVAIGVGINVLAPTDVADAVGLRAGVERADVLKAIVRAVRSAAQANGHLSREELDRYRDRDLLVGRRIVSPGEGTVAGIADNGAIIIDTAGGTAQFRAGTIRFAEDA